MKLVAEYKFILNKNYLYFYHLHANKISKRMKTIMKEVVRLKKQGCIIKNIKSKYQSMYDEPWFYYHVRIWK